MRRTITHVGTCITLISVALSAPAAAQTGLDAALASAEQFPEPLVIILVALAGLVFVARRYGGRDPREVEQELERRRGAVDGAAERPGPAQLR